MQGRRAVEEGRGEGQGRRAGGGGGRAKRILLGDRVLVLIDLNPCSQSSGIRVQRFRGLGLGGLGFRA